MGEPAYHPEACPTFHRAIELIGRRWTGVVLRALMLGYCRFSDISTAIPDMSDKMLSERLKELEVEGLVERRVHAETPVRIEYVLTPAGAALENVFDAIAEWAHQALVSSGSQREVE